MIACTLTFLCSAWELHAQSSDVKFEHLTAAQGLSSNEIFVLMQDSRGFMWFGGMELYKYDGYSFTTYKNDALDSTSISGPWINTLYEDRHGDLWIIANLQLNRFDRVTGKFTRHLSYRHPTSICEDTSEGVGQDCMWFTTFGQGICQYHRSSERFTEYRHNRNDSNSISSDSAYCAMVGVSGNVWIGAANGLNSLDRSRKQFAHYPHGPKGDVYTVYEDPDEPSRFLWIGTHDALYAYDKSSNSFSRYRNPFSKANRPEDNDVRTIYIDKKGRFWVGMMGGIARFDRSTRRFTSYQGGLWANTYAYVNKAWSIREDRTGTMWMISHWGPLRKCDEAKNDWTPVPIVSDHEVTFHAMCEDRSGTMWFGTVADAVLKLDKARKPFSLYTKTPGDSSSLSFSTVTGICEDASGTVWVGTMGGLNKLNASTGKFTHYLHDDRKPNSLSHDRIWPILEDSKERLWIGTFGGGLDEFDRNKQRFVHHRYSAGNSLGLPNDAIDALCESRDGTLWIGTDDFNITEYSPTSNIFRRHFPGYAKTPDAAAYVLAILEDHTGLIWIAVPMAGLSSYDRASDRWTQYLRDPNAVDGSKSTGPTGPLSLCEDRRGTIWVGTDVGLFRFDRQTETFIQVGDRDRLPDHFIRAILEDGKGCLWLCTTNTLSKFDPTNDSLRNYDASDGVKIGPCELPTGHKNRKGEMFFGRKNGMLRFHPDSIRDNPCVPPIVITAFKKFDKIVPLDSVISEKHFIEMSYKENVFSFEFVALNYTSPEKNQYAYKLEGFDNDWINCGTRRIATYTNLDGGSYIFRVKGSNNDGVWNEEGASIVVIITPPFWMTWWFRTLFLVVMLASVGGSIRYVEMKRLKRKIEQLEQERALERERSRISQDMHDEVGAGLSEIGILSELAKKDIRNPDESGVYMQRISETSREVIASISEIIWAINPKNDLLDDLVAYLRHYTTRYLGTTAMKLQFNIPETLPDFHLTAEARRNIFLVLKESLHNIIKHSGATEVIITLSFTQQHLEAVVQDNGKGFTASDISRFGNGLRNMEKRMKDIGGRFVIESNSGEGTRVMLTVEL